MTDRDDATQAQMLAADPTSSTWLSANAGSGKTRVLTERVARLLLDCAPPQNVLCLTYTKAAAGEMQNRLFRTLGAWAMMPDTKLAAQLQNIGAHRDVSLPLARTLFARAVETPGGLRIQTIHSFCSALLRQFPMEAGVSPRFTEIDASAQRHLLREVAERLAEDDPGGSVSGVAHRFRGKEFESFLQEIVGKREAFSPVTNRKTVFAAHGLSENLTPDTLLSEIAIDPALLRELQTALKFEETPKNLSASDKLRRVEFENAKLSDILVFEGVFLTGGAAKSPFSSKAGSFPTKAARDLLEDAALADLDALMDRVADVRPKRIALEAADRDLALHEFAQVLLPAYAAEKERRGWLDFDDLIERAAALLSNRSAAQWVLYKLDGKIDHILVDESQDTSPAQWRIIEYLTGEFGAGEGARPNTNRTLFVVGDKKQSIYSFQGADAEAFERMRGFFADRLRAAGGLTSRDLLHSFRSAPAILATVDATFQGDASLGLGGKVQHIAFHGQRPGRVDLWPLVPTPEKSNDPSWYDPVDRIATDHPSSKLAEHIAVEISRMIQDPSAVIEHEGGRRRLTEGDFLILVRGRSGQGDLFHSIIRECKAQGLSVAGADVMKLASELAVRDLRALLAFLALPEDSLSLAAALRSPLFGWSEQGLYGLAAGRQETYLWQSLRNRADEYPDLLAILDDLRSAADFLRPYDLLERVLVRHDGRRKLLSRLGVEAEDGIDELLNMALAYERQEIPSLTGFLAWLDSENTEVKRGLDQGDSKVRVMTVHGAKGLESPVVILPDTTRTASGQRNQLLEGASGIVHWPPAKDSRPEEIQSNIEAKAAQEERERQRLLYVAMTRAESWLIVCGIEPGRSRVQTWHDHVSEGLQRAGAVPLQTPSGPGLRLQSGVWSEPLATGKPAEKAPLEPLPDWSSRPAPVPKGPVLLSPSDLGGAKALPGEFLSEDDALLHGRRIHLLLEHLPRYPTTVHRDTAAALLATGEDAAKESDAHALADEVSRLVDEPALRELFQPTSLSEVAITARLPELGDKRILGNIDCLLVLAEQVRVIDFKTNRVVPDRAEAVPEGILRQMGAYLAAVRQLYPDKAVQTEILWTRTAQLMPLPHEIVMSALSRTATS